MWGKRKENGIWLAQCKGRRFIWRDGRIYCALGGLRLRLVYGEEKSIGAFMSIASQDALTSRYIPRHGNSKCKNFALEIDENINNRDFQMESFQCEVITKELKRSHKVGV